MTAREFCYWMQGFFEISNPTEITAEQTQMIKHHLDMVFVHEIDPSYPEAQQSSLNDAHAGKPVAKPTLMRC